MTRLPISKLRRGVLKHSALAGVVALFFACGPARATSFMLSDYSGTLKTFTGTTVTTINELAFGFFGGGFTPTTNNVANWAANFIGVSGYVDGGSPEWSASIDTADNLTYPVNTQLYLIAYNILDNVGVASATEAAIFTNSAWKIVAASGTDLVPNYFDFNGKYNGYAGDGVTEISRTTGTLSMVVGTLSGNQVTMAVIPEPAVAQTFMLGAMMCLSLRRRLNKTLHP